MRTVAPRSATPDAHLDGFMRERYEERANAPTVLGAVRGPWPLTTATIPVAAKLRIEERELVAGGLN